MKAWPSSLLTRAAGAAREGNLATLDRILSESPDVVAARDGDGRTLLDLACRAATGDIAIPLVPGTPEQHAAVDRILAAGADADPSAADDDGWTPLHTAAMAGHADLARRLVQAGASGEGQRPRPGRRLAPVVRPLLRQGLHGRRPGAGPVPTTFGPPPPWAAVWTAFSAATESSRQQPSRAWTSTLPSSSRPGNGPARARRSSTRPCAGPPATTSADRCRPSSPSGPT